MSVATFVLSKVSTLVCIDDPRHGGYGMLVGDEGYSYERWEWCYVGREVGNGVGTRLSKRWAETRYLGIPDPCSYRHTAWVDQPQGTSHRLIYQLVPLV